MDCDINKEFAALAKKIWEEKRIRVDSVQFNWVSVPRIGGEKTVLESVDTNQRSYHS